MKKLLLSVMAMFCVVMAKADETAANAILVWVDGSSTCYQLESMPRVRRYLRFRVSQPRN